MHHASSEVAWDDITFLALAFDLIMVLVVGVRYCRGRDRIDSLFEASASQLAARTRYEHRRDAEKKGTALPPEVEESGGEIGLIRATSFRVADKNKLFTEMDTDGDNCVSREEWLANHDGDATGFEHFRKDDKGCC